MSERSKDRAVISLGIILAYILELDEIAEQSDSSGNSERGRNLATSLSQRG